MRRRSRRIRRLRKAEIRKQEGPFRPRPEGAHLLLETLEPRVFIPMHAGAQGHVYREFIEECRDEFDSIQMVAPDNRGDHFVYKKGKIIDPKPRGTRQARAD